LTPYRFFLNLLPMMEYEPVIGLEVHVQLQTESKIFCGCATAFGGEPNTQACPVCMGMPGTLPVLNRKAVEYALRLALATNCKIAPLSLFARKNYFYPDLPKGYQISQYELPLATGGWIEIPDGEGGIKKVGIIRIHLEEDAGKLIHGEGESFSYVDFNRAGVPLVEIVTAPDLGSPKEAVEFLKMLRTILRYLEISDGDMEKGNLRCDANVSVRPRGTNLLGTRTEIKNMNSFRHVERALSYEIQRQIETLQEGKKIIQETRLWDPQRGVTVPMRTKEEAHDYRYFPEPDLLPLEIKEEWLEKIRANLPELPLQRRQRFVQQYLLPEYDATVLTSSKALADLYERCVSLFPDPKQVSNWITTELLRLLNETGKDPEECPIGAEDLAELLSLIKDGTISGKIGKEVLEEMFLSGKGAKQIVREKGLEQITDEAYLTNIITEIIQAHPKEVEEYRKGKDKLLGFFVGQVMKKTQGKANPQLTNKLLLKLLRG